MIKKLPLALMALMSLHVANAAPGTYVGAQGGVGGMYSKYSNYHTSHSKDNIASGFAYRVSLGYAWGLSALNYGFELGYSKYPHLKTTRHDAGHVSEKISSTSFDLLGVTKYSFGFAGTGFNVFTKAGMAKVNSQLTGNVSAPVKVHAKKSKTLYRPELDVGAGYDFSSNIGLNLSYNYIFPGKVSKKTSAESFKASPLGAIMLGMTYGF